MNSACLLDNSYHPSSLGHLEHFLPEFYIEGLMKSTTTGILSAACVRLLAIVLPCAVLISSASAATLTWSTAVNQTSSTTNQLRAVALADQPGNDSVYLGYIQTTAANNRRVNRHS